MRWVKAIWVLIPLFAILPNACVMPSGAEKKDDSKQLEKEIPEHLVFRSEDYLICMLNRSETAGSLAEKYLGDKTKAWIIDDFNKGVTYEKDQLIAIPLRPSNKGGLTSKGYQTVPILCYHRFADHCKTPACIPKAVFEQQMAYLKEQGFQVISLDRLFSFLQYREAVPKKSVIITIDDGYRSVYDIAYPILKRYGFKAALFVYTDFIGKGSNAMSWNHLKELKENGFEVGSHSVSHSDFTVQKKGESDAAYLERIKNELILSKQIIDKELAQDTVLLAFPFGKYNHKILSLCEQAGYQVALTVNRGTNPFFADPLLLKRSQIVKPDMKFFISNLGIFQEMDLSAVYDEENK